MVRIDIKPLSVNGAWQGRRFKTPEYKKFQNDVLLMLPAMKINKAPYELNIEFGYSSKLSDLDNGIKTFVDCLVKKYGFDDREIYWLEARKTIVPKGKEYIKFEIKTINE